LPITIKTTGFDEFVDPSGGAYIKALILGGHGVGKTRSASYWPKPIYADCEKGLMSVADRGVPYASIKSSADMNSLLEHLRMDGMKPPEKRQYKTLIIDTLDSYQRVLIQERLRAEKKESLSGWGDWGYLDAKMSQLIERALNLPINIVVNLHVKDEKDQDGESELLVKKARLKGDIKESIFQDFDLIGQMETSYAASKGERVLTRQIRWHSEPRFPMLRDRSGKLPRFTEVDFTEGDYQRIFDAIASGLDELPETADVETLAVEGDEVEPVAADVQGGPVSEPKIPAAKKAPAKKAAAKKAPAKKAAPKPEPAPEPVSDTADTEPEVNKETGEITEPELPTENNDAVDAEQVALLEAELGATPVEEEPQETPVVIQTPAEKEEQSQAPTNTGKKTNHCGDQPPSMVGKFDAYPGCGVELNAQNAGRASLSMLKFKTYLCDEDFEKAKAS
jgi:hypothetical protein